jgi:RHS repeat-associated protein
LYLGVSTTATITGLLGGTNYTFTVTATNNFGDGPVSGTSAAVTPSGTSTTYAGTVLADGPVAYYRLHDAIGLGADSSGNEQTATYNGTYTLGSASGLSNDADKSIYLNGGYVQAPATLLPSGNAPRTLETWVNLAGTGSGNQTVIGYGMSGATRTLFQVQLQWSSTIMVTSGNDNRPFTLPYAITNGNWHHLVVTYDGTALALYLDGQGVGTATFSDRLGTVADSNGLILGRDTAGCCNWVTGSMDEAAVYPTALTAAQVLNHFNASGWTRPAAPTGVTATAAANQATVNWTAPAGTVTGYLVTAMVGGVGQNSVAIGPAASTTITGLAVGSAYTFQVQAMNNFGAGPAAASSAVTVTAGSNPAYAATVIADGPIAYYRLDDAGGTLAADSSGAGQQGTYSGTYTLGQAGGLLNDSDKSLFVNGGTMTAPDTFMPMGNKARTIEAWVKVSGTGSTGSQGVAGYGTSGTRTLFNLRLNSTNQVGVVAGNDDHYFTAGYPLANGIWHQLAAAYDGTTLVVFADGQSIGQTTFAGAFGTQSNGSGLVVGRDSWAVGDWLNGNVDEVSVYSRALTSNQIANHWAAAGYRRPSAPMNPLASAGPQGAIVSWTVPSDLGNPPLTGYTITPFAGSTAATPVSVGPNLTNVTMAGLTAGTSYTYQIKANSVYDPPVASTSATAAAPALTPVPQNSSYLVFAGYANSIEANFTTPSPWYGSSNTTFVGTTSSWDSSAVRLFNLTSSPLTISSVTVDIGPTHFDLWGPNLTVPANGDLVLTQTAAYNFDGSDTPVSCTQSGYIPVVHVTANGSTMDYRDMRQVLNTNGIDQASCGGGEGTNWRVLWTGPVPSEIMGPNGSIKICWTCLGLPVNTASGDFWHTFTDFDIPGRGFNLHFDRTYNSQAAPFDGPLGYGWSDPYNMFLSFDAASGTVGVHQEAGSTVPFTLSGGTYTPGVGVLASLVRNGDGTFTFQRTDLARYVFNARGELLSETDRNGYATTFSYTSDQLTTVTEPAGRTLTFVYTGNRITRINDTAGNRNVTFTYDALGNLTKATDVGGASTTFTYDASHLMVTMTDPNGGTVTNVYDSSGRVTRQTDAMNRLTQFAYTPSKTTITDPNGNQTVDIYQNGELIQETKAFGTLQAATWSYAYDQVSLGIATVTDPNGHSTTNIWDPNGNLLSKTDALSQTSTYTYNAFNEVLTATDPLGVMSTTTYDATGNLAKTSVPLTGTTQYAITKFAYDSAHPGDLIQMTDANGKIWQYAYDAYGLRNKSIDPLADTTTYSFDNVGRLQSTVSPKGNVLGGNPSAYTTTFTSNAYGDRLSTLDPLGHLTTYKYDTNRNQTAVIDANNHQTTYVYDADNEVGQAVRPDGSSLKTVYDNDGNVTQQIDGLGNATTYQYNGLNQRKKMTDPLNRSTIYAYDGLGNVLTVQNPKDSSVSYTVGYDAVNQLKTITYSDGVTPNASLQYDADGQRKQMIDGTGTSTYAFDSFHRLVQNTNGAGAQISYGYDLLGHVTKLGYPGGTSTVNRTYDDAGRLSSVTDWLNNTTRFGYDANNNLISTNYPNSASTTFTYDAANRIMQIVDVANGSQFLNLTYGRDAGNQLSSDNSTTYGYDANNRVIGASTSTAQMSYSYDAGDNVARAVNGSNITTNVYDAGNQLQTATTMNGSTQVQKFTYGYDPNGNRISRTDVNNTLTNYGWDQAGRLTSYGSSATYSYNGDGDRLSKTVSGLAEPFVLDIAEGLALILKDGSVSYVTGPDGLPLEQVSGATVTYYHQDQLGSTRALTNSSGAIVASYTFDAFGNLVSTPPAFSNPFQFAGQYTDAESKLLYLRARYYEPAGFLSRDPATDETREPYSYTEQNPTNRVDPSGLAWWNQAASWGFGQAANLVGRAHDGAVTVAKAALGYGAEAAGDLGSHEPLRMVKGAVSVASLFVLFFPMAVLPRAGAIITMRVGATLCEDLAAQEARAAGRMIIDKLGDPSLRGFVKMQYVHYGLDGASKIVVHYVRNVETGVEQGFKVVFNGSK